MDNAIKAAMCFLVFCIGVAAVIFAVSYTNNKNRPQQCQPYQTYSVCPRCQQQFVEPPRFPNRPEIMPTPNTPYRPGSLTGDKGEKK